MSPSRRYRLTASTLAATIAVLAAGCAGHTTSSSTPHVLLTGGTYQGVSWSLYAWRQGRQLCMEVDGHGSATASGQPGAGACGFDHKTPTSGYYDSGPGPGDSLVSFGPLPERATQVRVATKEVLPTRSFPAGRQLPVGRYWIQIIPKRWPLPAEGKEVWPKPLNASGRPVAFQDF